MADNYNNTQGPDSMEAQPPMQPTDQGQQDLGVTDPSNVNTGVGPTGTDDTAPRDFSSEDAGVPKNYQGGEQGEYLGDKQPDSGYGANGGGAQQTGAGYGAGDTPAQDSNYQDPSATDTTGTYGQPPSDQSQFAQDTGAAGTDQTNGYGAVGQPPSTDDSPAGYGTGAETLADESTDTAPKKEGFLTKLKEKLPGHHKSSDEQTDAAYTGDDETGDQAPKKGLVTKIKEKVHM